MWLFFICYEFHFFENCLNEWYSVKLVQRLDANNKIATVVSLFMSPTWKSLDASQLWDRSGPDPARTSASSESDLSTVSCHPGVVVLDVPHPQVCDCWICTDFVHICIWWWGKINLSYTYEEGPASLKQSWGLFNHWPVFPMNCVREGTLVGTNRALSATEVS